MSSSVARAFEGSLFEMVSNPTLYRSIFIGLEIESGEEGTHSFNLGSIWGYGDSSLFTSTVTVRHHSVILLSC